MKLAIVVSHPIQHFCPQYASLAKHPDLQVKVFFASALGHKKYVDESFKQEISWDNLRLDEFDHQFLNEERVLPADAGLDAPELDEALAMFAPDVVVVYGYFQKYSRRAYRWARRNRVKLGYISDSELRQQRSAVKELLKYPYLRYYFSHIDFFLTVGDANESFYRHYGVRDSKIVRMHFPIDRIFYDQCFPEREKLNRELRARFGLSDTDLVCSVVGKLLPSKNQHDIIAAMKDLEDQGVITHLFVLGSGEHKEFLLERAKSLKRSRAIFPGFVRPEELPAYYAASDIYVHPPSRERHSLAISEAIYMGCPVIISDRCGSYGEDDDVQDNKNGYVFRCGDVSDLKEKMLLLINDPKKRKMFGEYSHSIAVRYQNSAHGGVIKSLLEKIK